MERTCYLASSIATGSRLDKSIFSSSGSPIRSDAGSRVLRSPQLKMNYKQTSPHSVQAHIRAQDLVGARTIALKTVGRPPPVVPRARSNVLTTRHSSSYSLRSASRSPAIACRRPRVLQVSAAIRSMGDASSSNDGGGTERSLSGSDATNAPVRTASPLQAVLTLLQAPWILLQIGTQPGGRTLLPKVLWTHAKLLVCVYTALYAVLPFAMTGIMVFSIYFSDIVPAGAPFIFHYIPFDLSMNVGGFWAQLVYGLIIAPILRVIDYLVQFWVWAMGRALLFAVPVLLHHQGPRLLAPLQPTLHAAARRWVEMEGEQGSQSPGSSGDDRSTAASSEPQRKPAVRAQGNRKLLQPLERVVTEAIGIGKVITSGFVVTSVSLFGTLFSYGCIWMLLHAVFGAMPAIISPLGNAYGVVDVLNRTPWIATIFFTPYGAISSLALVSVAIADAVRSAKETAQQLMPASESTGEVGTDVKTLGFLVGIGRWVPFLNITLALFGTIAAGVISSRRAMQQNVE